MMMSNRLNSLSKRGLLVLFGLGLGLVIAESTLRVLKIAPPSPYVPDRILGSRLRPNHAGWQTKEGRVFVRTNSEGFRDRPREIKKPSGTLRVAVLGDSYCEAVQVDMDEAFWAVMQRRLNECGAGGEKRLEVLNTGVSGYGTAQQLLMLRHHVWDYDPDIVVLCFFPGNDVRNNSKALETDKLKPFFHLHDGELVLDDSFLQRPYFTSPWIRFKDLVIRSSRLMTLAYRIKHRAEGAVPTTALLEPGLDDFVFREPETRQQRAAWGITERLIRELHEEVTGHDALFVIVSLTTGIQVHPHPQVREAFCEKLQIPDLSYPDRRMEQLAAALNCRLILLADPMRKRAETTGTYFHGFENTAPGQGHWNVEGHRVAGEIICQELCDDAAIRTFLRSR